MTQVLILGGTGWVSRRLAERWLAEGAAVTCLSRGTRAVPPGARSVTADRDDRDAYDGVRGQDWDEVVDVSSHPRQVAEAWAALADRAVHATYVSSVSVYADHTVVGADESAALAVPAMDGDPDDYSRAKAAAEASARSLGDRLAIVRPGLIAGPGDPSDRAGYWPARFAAAGDEAVLTPEGEGRHAQIIDVDDLVEFLVRSGARAWSGVVDAIGPSTPLQDVLGVARRVGGHSGPMVPVDDDWLLRHGVEYWAGPRSLPLWLPPGMPGFATRDGRAFVAAGGRNRPLEETMERILADERSRGIDRPRRAGLSRDEECALLAQR